MIVKCPTKKFKNQILLNIHWKGVPSPAKIAPCQVKCIDTTDHQPQRICLLVPTDSMADKWQYLSGKKPRRIHPSQASFPVIIETNCAGIDAPMEVHGHKQNPNFHGNHGKGKKKGYERGRRRGREPQKVFAFRRQTWNSEKGKAVIALERKSRLWCSWNCAIWRTTSALHNHGKTRMFSIWTRDHLKGLIAVSAHPLPSLAIISFPPLIRIEIRLSIWVHPLS